MKGRIQIGDARIISINRKQILRQVIAADRDKVDTARKLRRLIDRRGQLDHHSHGWVVYLHSLLGELAVCLLNEFLRFFHLAHIANHRQHDLQIIQTLTGPQHGSYLRHENFRVVESDPNTPPAEKRVSFFDREIRKCFIAAYIQGSHGDKFGRESLQLFTVNLILLLLTWEAFA